VTSHHAHQRPWDLSRYCLCFASIPDSSAATAQLLVEAGQYDAARRLVNSTTPTCFKAIIATISYFEYFLYFAELSVSDSDLPG